LSGRRAVGGAAYLGRFHSQISVLAEDAETTGAAGAASHGFTTYNVLATSRPPRSRFRLSTAQRGAAGPLVPMGGYERVMPLDVLPTPLLRALMVGDSDMAQALGCLELDEEDLALCTVVCASRIDHGGLLRQMLDRVEKEW
jgi:Na+-transporting NADH:ubiquinone oxidoreductase subunit A